MTHPSNANEFQATMLFDLCPWMHAYVALRNLVFNPANAAAPVPTIHGAILVIEGQLSRDLDVPQTSVIGLIAAYNNRIRSSQDAKDGGESPVG